MSISYGDYKKSCHSIIPDKDAFARYSDIAERKIKKFVRSFKAPTDKNKRCVYEIADILYAGNNRLNLPLAGFSNENYRENYFDSSGNLSIDEKIFETVRLYFTSIELYRGV
ncbi:MAG: hypothetical protein FWH10_07250 [Oscillospiraceae bacterium]|nr:hypothetical protein [Oscillospiraceae bacterium]